MPREYHHGRRTYWSRSRAFLSGRALVDTLRLEGRRHRGNRNRVRQAPALGTRRQAPFRSFPEGYATSAGGGAGVVAQVGNRGRYRNTRQRFQDMHVDWSRHNPTREHSHRLWNNLETDRDAGVVQRNGTVQLSVAPNAMSELRQDPVIQNIVRNIPFSNQGSGQLAAAVAARARAQIEAMLGVDPTVVGNRQRGADPKPDPGAGGGEL